MEGLSPLHRRVAGFDVHRLPHGLTVLVEQPDDSVAKHSREFGGFQLDCRTLAAWRSELQVERVVMESTGMDWKSVCAHLENAGIPGMHTEHRDSKTATLLITPLGEINRRESVTGLARLWVDMSLSMARVIKRAQDRRAAGSLAGRPSRRCLTLAGQCANAAVLRHASFHHSADHDRSKDPAPLA